MKKRILTTSLFIALSAITLLSQASLTPEFPEQTASSNCASSPKAKRNFTIASFNIRNGLGLDNTRDLNRPAEVIKKMKADVIAIQELDSMATRTNKTFVIKDLADKVDMHYSFASAIKFDGGSYGVGLLSKQKPIETHKISLPGREEQRVLLVCEFDEFVMLVTHLSLTEQDAMASVPVIAKEMAKYNKPVFLAGDLNIEPTTKVYAKLTEIFTPMSNISEGTFPADKPKICIDYIFARTTDKTQLKHNEVVAAPNASDHAPIKIKVKLSK